MAQSTRKIVNLWDKLYLLEPSAAPIWTLVNKLKTVKCLNPKVEWLFNKQSSSATKLEWNICQIFRKTITVTHTLGTSKIYGGSERQYQRKKKGVELLRDFECATVFGNRQRNTNYLSPNTIGGISYFANKYSTIKSKTPFSKLNETRFEKILREVFKYGSAYRFLAYGKMPSFMRYAKHSMRAVPIGQTYGISVNQWVSPHGTINMIEDPVLGDFGVLCDLSSMALRPLSSRGCQLYTNVQNPGDDFTQDTYISEWTVELRTPDNYATIGKTGMGPIGVSQGSTINEVTLDRHEDYKDEVTLDDILFNKYI